METTFVVVDTDIVVDFLRRRTGLLRQIKGQASLALSAVTVYELLSVPTLSERQYALLNDLFSQVSILAFDSRSAMFAAQVYRYLTSQGALIGLPDMLIAGICLAYEVPLVTRNQVHFARVPGLSLIDPATFNF